MSSLVVKISPRNNKLGKIPNISTVPVKDCGDCDHCRADCYALKAWRQYPAVRKAWGGNSKAFRNNPAAAFSQVQDHFAKAYARGKAPRFFRIHVAGDFLDQAYLNNWADIAGNFNETKFLAFTKMSLDYSNVPSNLTIIHSQWPGRPVTSDIPGTRAWVQDGTETRIPADAIECPGLCDDCGMCWDLPDIGKDIFFHSH